MNADQLAAEYERGYRDGGYQATAAHSSKQSADTKRLEILTNAAKGLLDVCRNGWITPEDKSDDYKRGWDDACGEFNVCQASLVLEETLLS